MANKKILIAATLALAISIAGCSAVNKPAAPGNKDSNSNIEENKQENVMKEYYDLVNKEVDISEYISFMDENIRNLSTENASKLIIKLEEIQKEHLQKLEEKYYTTGNIQNTLHEMYKPKYDLSSIDVNSVMDGEVKKVLEETIRLGYKVESAEGMFFPIIDYSFYEKHSSYATQDIKDYINIMKAESDKVPAKDAGLVISWDELFDRAFKQEKFLIEHKDSAKFEEVKYLYGNYITFVTFGLDNTPLFNYQDKKMNADARTAYKQAITKDSKLSQTLKEYYEAIEKDGFKLTDKVKSYRDDLVKSMKYLP